MRAMSPRSAEVLAARTMRALALTFAVVGVLFVAWPDGTLHRLDQVGNWFGGFARAPEGPEKPLAVLSFPDMIVVIRLALFISTHAARHRPLLVVLPPGEAPPSLSARA